jgi:hypothetical protein
MKKRRDGRWVTRLVPWKRVQSPSREDCERLVAESEAYLTGRYAHWRLARREAVPGWAWLNTLAHGSIDDLVAMTAADSNNADLEELVADTARELLSLMKRTGVSLVVLQRSMLLPLETRLRDMYGWESPRDREQLAEWFLLAIGRSGGPRPRWVDDPPLLSLDDETLGDKGIDGKER